MGPKLKASVRLVATLAAAGLLSGLVLVAVYQATLPTIQRNQAEALQRAIFQVLPGTRTTATLVFRDGRLIPLEGHAPATSDPIVYAGFDDNRRFVGYAIAADGPGFMDTVKLIYGFDPVRRVITGMSVLESRETPGLGDRIVGDEHFHQNFLALRVEPEIVPVKKGQKTADNEVDCITGATISSEAVVSILSRSTRETLAWMDGVAPPEAPQK